MDSYSIYSSRGRIENDYHRIDNMPMPDDDKFPTSKSFDDGVYSGTLYRKNVSYEKFTRKVISHRKIVERTYNDTNFPSMITVRESTASGYLYAKSVKVTKTNYKTNTIEDTIYYPVFITSFAGGNIITSDYNYSYSYMSINVCLETTTKEVKKEKWLSKNSAGAFDQKVVINGEDYLFTGQTKSKTVETWVKHYGHCRYWGGGGKSSNNYYGDPDYRFRVHGWTAKGFMNGEPTPTLDRYGHKKEVICRHKPQKYPIDVGGYWTTNSGEKKGIAWTYDIDEARKYGGSADPAKGGVVWASAFNGKSFPPNGYSSDYMGSSHCPLNPGNNGTINQGGLVITKNGAQKTSTAGFYNYGGFYCKWFRDVILFYKGRTTATAYDGLYECISLEHLGSIISSLTREVGMKSKKETVSLNEAISSITVNVTYEGEMYSDEVTYSGIAAYEGEVIKSYSVKPPRKTIKKDIIGTIDSEGFISYRGKRDLEKKYIVLTDYSYYGTPLYYSYKCNFTVELLEEDDEIITDKKIVLISSQCVYVCRLKRLHQNTFSVEILLDREISFLDQVYITDISSTKKELISTTLIYNQGIDFNSYDGGTSFRFGKYSIIEDTRRKINVTFRIMSNNGETSSLYKAKIVNKKYALNSERNLFLQNMILKSHRLA